MSSSQQEEGRTRALARALGLFFAIVPTTIAFSPGRMTMLLHAFEADPMWQWVLGAAVIMLGSVIVALNQSWHGAAAIIISVIGWVMLVRGVIILVFPHAYNAAGDTLTESSGVYLAVRGFFFGFGLIGLYLAYYGWFSKPKTAAEDSVGAPGR